MPKGVYIRTEKINRILSKARRKWIRENPEAAHENAVKIGRLGDKVIKAKNIIKWMEENPEEYRKSCSRAGKIGGRAGRGISKPNSGKSLIKWKKEHPEIAKSGAELNKWRRENPKKAKKVSRENGKRFRESWKKDRKKMLEGCYKGGKASIQKQQKSKPSYIELTVRKYLDELKIKYKPNVWFKYNGTRKEADIIIPKYNLIIECDGWRHNTVKVKTNDKFKTKLFNKLGYRVLRIKGIKIKDSSFKRKILDKINQIEKWVQK